MTLHTVGPESMQEDERRIGKAYQSWLGPVLVAAPVIAVNYVDIKFVAAFGLGAALLMLHEMGGRLHDLCIRLRRTNILLRDQQSISN